MTRIARPIGIAALAFGLLAAGTAFAAPADAFNEVLEASLKDKKGVMVYVKGQAIGGRVTKITADAVELAGREYARIVVRKDAIDAVAGN